MLLLPLQRYVETPNLAEYLGLRPVDALHMSVPINAIFIGFQGDGNSKVCVGFVERSCRVALSCTV
jgi:hypothetical protein